MKLMELRDVALQYFSRQMPNVPKYIVQDFIYKNYKNNPKEATEAITWANQFQWKQRMLNITLDVWDQDTNKRLQEREGGSKNPYKVPNDEERHATQQQLLSQGPSKEPIIVTLQSGKYELVEGWHRTIQSMAAWPNGYKQTAWVGDQR